MATNYDAIFGDIVFSANADPAAVQTAISAGHDINCTNNSDSWNALHYALNPIMWPPNTDVVRVLLANGCAVNTPDREQWTPLHFAARTGCADTIALLLDSGADPNSLDRESVTPFHRYFLRRPIETSVVQLFVRYGAIPTDAHRYFATVCEYPEKDAVLPLLPARA